MVLQDFRGCSIILLKDECKYLGTSSITLIIYFGIWYSDEISKMLSSVAYFTVFDGAKLTGTEEKSVIFVKFGTIIQKRFQVSIAK